MSLENGVHTAQVLAHFVAKFLKLRSFLSSPFLEAHTVKSRLKVQDLYNLVRFLLLLLLFYFW